MNVYDVALDFVLLDAFDDMQNPPSALVNVLHNRWLTDNLKLSVSQRGGRELVREQWNQWK